jgi:protein phosphatase
VAEILRSRSSLAQAAKALVDDANARGGKDNITVLLFKLGEEADAAGALESDTLSGTEVPLADTVEGPPAEPLGDAAGDTVVIGPEEAARARAAAEPQRASTATVAPPRAEVPPPRPVAPRRGRRRPKIVLGAILALVVLIASLVGLYEAQRQFYFVGTDDTGLITLYRGVPYDLPLGVKLYSKEYESTVPAVSLPTRQRQHVLDNKLRGKGDAVDLVRSLERTQG